VISEKRENRKGNRDVALSRDVGKTLKKRGPSKQIYGRGKLKRVIYGRKKGKTGKDVNGGRRKGSKNICSQMTDLSRMSCA